MAKRSFHLVGDHDIPESNHRKPNFNHSKMYAFFKTNNIGPILKPSSNWSPCNVTLVQRVKHSISASYFI